MTLRRSLAAVGCVAALAFAGVACTSESRDDSGATTNLEDVGPDLAKLRLEVDQLRDEVRSLRQQLALLTPGATTTSTTAPLR